MAIKVEQQLKRGSGTRAGHNSSFTSWKSSHAKPLDKSQTSKPEPKSTTTSHIPQGKTEASTSWNRDDGNQQASLKDPLHVPVGPITRARSKMIK
jgi:hypothetical protein